jgi:hypothetical protein
MQIKLLVISELIKSRRIWWVGHVERMGERRGEVFYRVLVMKAEGKRPLGRPRRR